MIKNMMYRTATCSGRAERSGNVLRMSVKTLDTGWEYMLRSGFNNEDTLG